MIMRLKYIGTDSWSRPVYEDETGRLWKDTNLDSTKTKTIDKSDLCSSNNNEFDGEPDAPMDCITRYDAVEIELIF